jgi:hypothetical protein
MKFEGVIIQFEGERESSVREGQKPESFIFSFLFYLR